MPIINGSFLARLPPFTLGMAPDNWLIEQRIVLSKKKLRDDRLSLTDVAAECGFSETKVTSREFSDRRSA